jgi:phage/plasmid-associated DNA primase
MSASDLYGHYKTWCEKNGEKHIQSMSKFGCNIGDTLKKSRTEKGFSYELPSPCENVTEAE